ncbi:unnamed protein product [Spirodela intermedia]|uniref:Amine oxidase domain-containing protein n=1 Tax=Spirodela intermedia TaxID=51605 RepID=A0A7I8JPU5_SPIIN|nr:unnamed protein product [Spirodela intermedia]CAA6671771.1 unnamed protein product [Spirodela intermedia]
MQDSFLGWLLSTVYTIFNLFLFSYKDKNILHLPTIGFTCQRKQSLSPSAIVIGAGFAGIAAARALKDASFKVVLLEARDRLGGRVYTDNSFGFPVDMGASWLHGVCKENPLAPVIGRMGLPLYRTSGDNSVLFDHDLESYALFDIDGNQVPHQLATKVGEVFETILKETEKLRQGPDEDMSIKQRLQLSSTGVQTSGSAVQEGLAHEVLEWYICRMEGWFSTDADKISLNSWDKEELLSGGHGLMVRGYLPVIKKLAKGLDIRPGVTKIKWGKKGARVSVGNGKTFIADVAVIAVPIGVLKATAIQFEPGLPESRTLALHFGSVFWPNVEFLGVVSSTTYHCSYFLNLHKATGHPVLEAARFAFTQVKKILPNIQYLVSRWGADENSLGSYTYDGVGKSHDVYEKLRIPVDNLFFAGEATSMAYPGTVHGAFATGLMAAEDCRMHVAGRHADLDLCPAMGEEAASVSVPLLISRM